MPGGKRKNGALRQKNIPLLSTIPLSLPLTFEGLFELTRRPSKALDLPRALLLELKIYMVTVRCAVLGAEVPGHCQKQLAQTLIVRLLIKHFFTPILDSKKPTQNNRVIDQT